MRLKTIKNVPLLEAGIEYQLSTGPKTFTPEDLVDIAMAANEDPAIPSPRLKIGHVDPRFNDTKVYDGTPSFGMAKNLRMSENGMTLSADFEGVPEWLADIAPVAFPNRSVEVFWNVESQAGGKWRAVCTAVALLGVVWPGINQLEDLPLMYGDEMPPEVMFAEAVAASNLPGGDPMGANASANLDDVRRAFYNEYLPEHQEARWWWVRQVLTDPNQLVTEDDETGELYLLSFSSDDAGTVSFGDAEAVRIDYVPKDRDAQKAAASHIAATLAAGRQVLASYTTRAASRPDNPGGAMDPKEVRKALNLPEDASDEQVQEALLKAALTEGEDGSLTLVSATVTPSTEETPEETPAPAAAKPKEQPAPASVAPVPGGTTLPPGTVLVDEETLKQMQAGLSRVDKLVEDRDAKERQELVAAAIAQGKIPPSRKEHWETYLEKDIEGGKASLAALKGNIVPIREEGHGRAPNELGSVELEAETVNGWTKDLFPETRGMYAAAAAAEQGQQVRRSRISGDGSGNVRR